MLDERLLSTITIVSNVYAIKDGDEERIEVRTMPPQYEDADGLESSVKMPNPDEVFLLPSIWE